MSTALRLRGLTRRIGAVTIVDDVDLALGTAEFVAVIGPNGAGKTSVFDLISGISRPSAGRIELLGADVTALPAHARAHRGLGRTFQTSAAFSSMSVADNVRLAIKARRGGSHHLHRRAARDRAVNETAGHILDRVGLSRRAATGAGALSHGEKRKLELALLIAGDAPVLLLDEPMAGMSMEEVPALVEAIRDLHVGEPRHSVLMVEHHMDTVLDLADRVAVMHQGALLACADPAQVMADPVVQEAYLGAPL